MKVVALSQGFYAGSLYEKGAEFEVAEGDKAKWFAPVDVTPKPAKESTKAKGKGKQPDTLSEMGQTVAQPFTQVNGDSAQHEAAAPLADVDDNMA